jgi:Mycoplasma protein of unknown function, DUF285
MAILKIGHKHDIGVFWHAEKSDQDVSSWDVSKVTDMHHIFY